MCVCTHLLDRLPTNLNEQCSWPTKTFICARKRYFENFQISYVIIYVCLTVFLFCRSSVNPRFWIPVHIVIPERPTEIAVFIVVAGTLMSWLFHYYYGGWFCLILFFIIVIFSISSFMEISPLICLMDCLPKGFNILIFFLGIFPSDFSL